MRIGRASGWGAGSREAVARIGLLVLGVVLALGLLELGLRAAASWVGPRALPAAGARETWLALGDSHTYGVFFEAEQAYPGQLSARLEAREPGRYRVLNLGLPGTNSSEVAARLPGWLERYGPTRVLLCVGVNNIWNRSEPAASEAEGEGAAGRGGLRVVRLAQLLAARFAAAAPDPGAGRPEVQRRVVGRGDVAVEFRDERTGELLIRHEGNFDVHRPLPHSLALLRRDLERIRAATEAHGAELVLLTYAEHPADGRPSPAERNHAAVNAVLRAFAAEHDLPLVDAAARIRARVEEGGSVSDFFHPDGSHPTPKGYAEIVEAVSERLLPAPGAGQKPAT